MNTPPSSSSRLPRPSLARSSPSTGSGSTSRYVRTASPSGSASGSHSGSKSNRSRSKSTLSQPKILPIPELSLRAQEARKTSREGSRATSPLSTPPIDGRLEVTFDQLISMSRGGSSEGHNNNGHGHGRRSSSSALNNHSSTATPTLHSASTTSLLVGSTSPPIPSPLAVSAARLSRARASTAPSQQPTTPTISPPPGISSTVGRSGPATTPRRTEGFRPTSPGLSRVTTNVPTSSTNTSNTDNQPRPNPSSTSNPVNKQHQTYSGGSSHTTTQISPSTLQPIITSSIAIIPFPSNQQTKEHLYQSFLKGICADVRLIIRKWGVCYHLHKMILAQMSFFQSLFLGGFSETHPVIRKRGKGKGKERAGTNIETDTEWDGEDVELTFDDPNITRAAFEICLSRLYSSYPQLQFPTDLLPTATHPLTPSFPKITSTPDYPTLQALLSPKAHLATPRLLLSLLATTTYLGHGVLMREVLTLILRTVGPLTVCRYLSFAIGDGIGEEEYTGQTQGGVRSLMHVAKTIRDDGDISFASRQTSDEDLVEEALHSSEHTPRSSSDSGIKLSDSSEDSIRHGGIPIPSLQFPSRTNSMRSTRTTDDPFSTTPIDTESLPHYYGVVGNRIGEACCCWLARWGVDILAAELEVSSPAYKIWSYGGLPANLVRAIISSDYFFVLNEMERYRFARKVSDLRRSGWDEQMEDGGDLSSAGGGVEPDDGWEEWEEEESQLLKTFAEGIYYCHMTFEDLSTIAADIDPSTHLPYAPLPVLQAAHWAAADLRTRVAAHEKSATSEDDNELGLTQSTTAICTTGRKRRPGARSRVPSPAMTAGSLSTSASPWKTVSPSQSFDTLSSLHSSQQTIWYAIPTDETIKIGASGLLSLSSSMQYTAMNDLPEFGPDPMESSFQHELKKNKVVLPHGERTSFGLLGGKSTGKEIEEKWLNDGAGGAFSSLPLSLSGLGLGENNNHSNDASENEKWTKIEPYRFSVEFFNVDKLTEKERFYSSTHFYAGSYFNCYVQMIKRKEKGLQLGIYLHRQSPNEPFPAPSSPKKSSSSNVTSTSLAPPILTSTSPLTHNRHLSNSLVVPGSPPNTALPGSLGSLPSPPNTTTTTTNSNDSTGSSSATTSNNNKPPYIDSRSVTKAFFSISCASALGTALIRFTSGPDCFALSQSWGWKSSALKSEEYLCVPPTTQSHHGTSHHNRQQQEKAEGGEDGDGGNLEGGGEEQGILGWTGELPHSSISYGQCSLRATVVVGVV
ncbi:uncharacterized protein L201_001083 [Kwoniella dendrophila CBS 6074]|uniref:BTB domain-containing protein n=1 Tax=Kwoniella dendrophila CBS 6074 TaxID=1295534 RepID=A0AAX4JNS3_9TREE